jgi:MFS transporter
MVSGAATAALAELLPGSEARRAALLATLAQAGGGAGGPLFAGFVAQWAPDPMVLPYLLGLGICLLQIGLLRIVPETGARGDGRWKIQRPRVPAEIRADFARVAITAAAAWAVAASLFLAILPSYASEVLKTDDLALLGAVAATMLLSSCAAQLLARRGAPPAEAQAGGLTLLALGLLALVLATPLGAPALLIAGAVLAGVGHGLAILAAQDDLTRIAPGGERAAVSAAFYVCIYLGVAGPVIGIGILAAAISIYTAVSVFAAVTGTAALIVAAWHLRHRSAEDRPRDARARDVSRRPRRVSEHHGIE